MQVSILVMTIWGVSFLFPDHVGICFVLNTFLSFCLPAPNYFSNVPSSCKNLLFDLFAYSLPIFPERSRCISSTLQPVTLPGGTGNSHASLLSQYEYM